MSSSQGCANYGSASGSSCSCPVGFGGSNCSQPACGGTIFDGSDRSYAPLSSNGFANLTAAGCNCQDGWTGTGCNVCQTSSVCQSASGSSGSTSSLGGSDGFNNTMVCNTEPRVWAASEMSCNVNNPTLRSLFPLQSTLTISRIVDPALSPVPNDGTRSNNTVYAQLFYAGVEQFYCRADTCAQTVSSDSTNSSTFNCQNLECTCISDTTFCTGLSSTIDGLDGELTIDCTGGTCGFQQSTLRSLFGSSGLTLEDCVFGECVPQRVIDQSSGAITSDGGSTQELSPGVIAGIAVVGGLLLIAFLLLLLGLFQRRKARKAGYTELGGHRAGVDWDKVSYFIPAPSRTLPFHKRTSRSDDKVILDAVSGHVAAGTMMAILGPSGAGKTTLVEILAGKQKTGVTTGRVSYPSGATNELRIGFVPQQDVLPPMLSVYEALLFAARMRLPEGVSDAEKRERVEVILEQLNIKAIRDVRIGGGRKGRGISGGEMRRVSIGLELVASPDVLILDEPTSGLDSVSASRVAKVLHAIAHHPTNPIAVIASIHQPSSHLYQTFDSILLLSHGRALYNGPGGFAPAEHFSGTVDYTKGYNVADYLLEIASDPPLSLFDITSGSSSEKVGAGSEQRETWSRTRTSYATTFLSQLEYLCGREWKILCRDKTLFVTHVAVSSVLGVFCGGLYYQTDTTIAGFQSRVGCLFFLGALIAFSCLSALYNVVEIRPLFVRERSSLYYSPTAWLLSRFLFDVIPLRIVPTIIVSTITYWMAGLSPHAANFFKFLLILVLYTLAVTLFNFLLGTLFENGGVALLLSALSALYQMTFAGFFVHLNSIPPVLRWLQWLCPLKYTLEALSVNEITGGLMIQDELEGVAVDVSASLIMNLLFGFDEGSYYRDVLVMVAFIGGFALMVVGVVWFKVRERR